MMQRARFSIAVSSSGEMRLPQKTWNLEYLRMGEHGDHLLCNLPPGKKHPEHLVPEDGIQFFSTPGAWRRRFQPLLWASCANIDAKQRKPSPDTIEVALRRAGV